MMNVILDLACNCFIVVILVIFLGWDLPDGSIIKRFVRKFSKPIVWTGLSHNWAMFAPNPISTNELVRCDIKLRDGQWENINFDFFSQLDSTEQPEDIRILKMQHSLTCQGSNAMKPGFALFAAREYLKRNPHVPPQQIAALRITRLYQTRPAWPPRKMRPRRAYYETVVYRHDFSKDRIWHAQIQERQPELSAQHVAA